MDFDKIYNGIINNFDISESFLDDILTTLEFRLNKNHYHYSNISKLIEENPEKYTEFIYYECENLIINIRSTVDNLLQLINKAYNMGYNDTNVNLKNVLSNKKSTNALKDVFLLYTHPKNGFWKFIYTTRNEIVHEVCIKTQLPIIVDIIYSGDDIRKKVVFINRQGDKEDTLYFYKECLNLMDGLCDKALYILSNGLK